MKTAAKRYSNVVVAKKLRDVDPQLTMEVSRQLA